MARRVGETADVSGEAGDPGIEGGPCIFAAMGGTRTGDDTYIGVGLNLDYYNGFLVGDAPAFFAVALLIMDSDVFSFSGSFLEGLLLTCGKVGT